MSRFGRHHLRADLLSGGAIRCPRRGEDIDIDACLSCTTRSDDGTGCWMLAASPYEERDPAPLLPFWWDDSATPW